MDLQKIANMAARIMQNLLKRQAPKGKLRSSIRVTAKMTPKGFSFTEDYFKYGVYLNRGTGPYYSKQLGEWNPSPGKGKGGIRPRYWTALDSMTRTSVAKLFTKALKDQAIEDIKNTIK
jgi:hypothetical protein